MANNQSVRRHLDAFTRGRIIGKLEEGRSVTSVASEFGIAHSIVSRLWRQLQTTGTAIRGFSTGRPQGTTPADDRYIALQARRNRRQTAGEIARHTTQATGRPISRFTVARRLHGGGLFARRPVRCVPLTPAHRRRRSLWCREHRNWRDNEWGRVLFTDESRFSLSCDSRHIHIWTERGTRNNPFNIIKRDCFGGRGVLVRADIMLGSRTDLHISQGGSSPGTAIVTRFFFLTCVFSQGLWVLSSSSWTTTLHLIAQLLSKSCWRVKILNTWIGRQALLKYQHSVISPEENQLPRSVLFMAYHHSQELRRKDDDFMSCRDYWTTLVSCTLVASIVWNWCCNLDSPFNVGYRTQLQIFKEASVTAVGYQGEVLHHIVKLIVAVISPDFLRMDDITRPLQAIIVNMYLEIEGISRMEWPLYFPSLNPIENLSDALGRVLFAVKRFPASLRQLETTFIEDWPLLVSALVDHLIESMDNRVKDYVVRELQQRNLANDIVWMQDNAPPYVATCVRQVLQLRFGDRVVSRNFAVSWLPRSPDLIAMDYWPWDRLKSTVYTPNPQNLSDLKDIKCHKT
ncbi:Transposable element Tcb1 transposase, partial [Stegodyphus mimosarum]